MSMLVRAMRISQLIHCTTAALTITLSGCSGWRGHSSEDYDAYGDPVRTIGVTWSDEKQPKPGIKVELKPDETPPVLPVPELTE